MTMAIAGTQTLNDAAHTGVPSSEETTNRKIDDLRSLALECLEDMKAEETIEIDLMGRTSLADTMIITSGRSQRHVGAIADRVLQEMKTKGLGTARVEGLPACDWVLIDAGDVIVHIFRPEVRGFYNLEKMWGADRPAAALPSVALAE
ncbi:ribosome silencing factor [Methylobacterium sp. J-078]|uniref:ribosome silencing factor n=1 Tax=Methylobacterium sp. J-078 TaxID=2836657 RepID=UPI001FBABB33|nr:ribosome silencing factor [Methylobacterium sp. J-078]MCJ2045732.1 ribosome silencing factor [Methylobacterium sp. J-078]